jgi:hypothetical protein
VEGHEFYSFINLIYIFIDNSMYIRMSNDQIRIVNFTIFLNIFKVLINIVIKHDYGIQYDISIHTHTHTHIYIYMY